MAEQINIVYFAWVRESLGVDEEIVELSDDVQTIGQLIGHLLGSDDRYASVFSDLSKLRFALDHDFVQPDAAIGTASELAIFPPVTGG